MKYQPNKIEKKWQRIWEESKLFQAVETSRKPKFYGLIEFPYPSGEGLHTGHLRSNTAMDIICRKRRMQGHQVLYPIGFDSFGLPTENFAVKKKIKPQITTKQNIKTFIRQLKSLGFSFDWSRAFSTTDPEYYQWTQWIFLQMFKKGLAYKAKENINWCPSCKIGLANEEVIGGECERCGGGVVKKEKEQWMLKITKYAERLIEDLRLVDYLPQITEQQINWIGKSKGTLIKFKITNSPSSKSSFLRRTGKLQKQGNPSTSSGNNSYVLSEPRTVRGKSKDYIEVFTTRPDTLFGATYFVLAPEHPLITNNESRITNYEEVREYIKKAKNKSELERTDLAKEKTGVELQGIRAINPATGEEIPIWVADYVMISYGTGAIMAVPAHDERDWEFAKKYHLPIKKVISGGDSKTAYTGEGTLLNSGEFTNLHSQTTREKITEWLEKNNVGKNAVTYKLRDWVFSRQRYWGEPIPIIYCRKCWESTKSEIRNPKEGVDYVMIDGKEYSVIPIPEDQLPVILPNVKDFLPTEEGDSPLAKAKHWMNTECPVCGGKTLRETDVMPNWAGSNWYFLRYCDPHNPNELVDPHKARYWMPVDWYNGGMEHTTLHLLYSRFVYKFLYDIGAIPKEIGPEPYKKRTAHGMILGHGGVKMSKSKGNIITPDDYVKKYGADTTRLYEMFMGPFDQAIAWDDNGVVGVYRFVERVWKMHQRVIKTVSVVPHAEIRPLVHRTVKKVGDDIEEMKFNTAVSQLMILMNAFEQELPARAEWEAFVLILSPFAPHLAEELWSGLGHNDFIINSPWPQFDPSRLQEETVTIAVQFNGKFRGTVVVSRGSAQNEVLSALKADLKLSRHLTGEPKKVIFIKDRIINIIL